MQTTKKKPSLIFILVGAVLAGYLGYLINGAWAEGIAFNEFMNRFNEVCAVPFANYYNSNTVKAVAIALGIYAMAIVMYYTSQRNYMPGKEFGTARFENPKQVNKILADKDENFNRILSQNVKMSLDFRKLKLNGNILICGGSGAGKTFKEWPEMEHNIIPYIGGEEEKSEQEPLRIWGKVENGQIVKADGPLITSQCIRVPVLDGHTAAVFVNFKQKPTKEELIQALVEFKGAPQELGLPNAPKQFIQYLEEDDRPQVALDVNYENGFGVSIGRLRKDAYFDWKFVGLSHNTVRGAAGGAVLMAELLKAKGYITAK